MRGAIAKGTSNTPRECYVNLPDPFLLWGSYARDQGFYMQEEQRKVLAVSSCGTLEVLNFRPPLLRQWALEILTQAQGGAL